MKPDCSSVTAKLLIVDGHAYAYRAFHAIRHLTSPAGAPTNAIYGFIKMLEKMRAELAPSHLVVVWDGGLAVERTSAWPEYKSQRPPMPQDLERQFDGFNAYLRAAGLASYCEEGVEADDWIAAMAQRAVAQGLPVVVASADKDFLQLVRSAAVELLNPNDKSGKLWGEEEVQAKTGVAPRQIVDWLSLMGDNVDNIPGVTGVGPKTATALLQQFGSVECLYARLGEVKSEALQTNLRQAEAAVLRNRELIRLKTELADVWSPAQTLIGPSDAVRLAALYGQWGFKTLLAQLSPAPRQEELF